MQKNQRRGFFLGAFILISANVIEKVIGFIFKVPLANLLGEKGMGYFSIAYTFYAIMIVVSTAGLPSAISKLVSESNALGRKAEVRRIKSVALSTFLIFGFLCSATLFAIARPISLAIKVDPNSYYSIMAISPAVFFVCLMSIYRGYFQGHSFMLPTAVSQVTESFFRMIFGLAFAFILSKNGFPVWICAAGAIAGVAMSTVFGSIVLFLFSRRSVEAVKISENTSVSRTRRQIFKSLLKTAVPTTIGAAVLTVTSALDTLQIPQRLMRIGIPSDKALELYGAYSGYAVQLFNLPPAFIIGMAISVLPVISRAKARGERDRIDHTIETALRFTAIAALPCAAGFFTLAKPILNLLYPMRPSAVQTAAPLLQTLSFAVLFISLVSVTSSILQALGKVNVPVVTMFCGGVVKYTANYILVSNPNYGISGAPVGTMLCYTVISLMNIGAIIYYTKSVPNFAKILIKPIIAAAVIGVAAHFGYAWLAEYLHSRLAVIAVVAVVAVLYAFMLFMLRIISREDLEMLPKSAAILKIIRKVIPNY